MTGTVYRLVPDRGFGLIRGADNRVYFFHHSALLGDQFAELVENDEVEFEFESVIITPKGPRTNSVRRKNPAPTEAT